MSETNINAVRLVVEPLEPAGDRKPMASPLIDGRFGNVSERLGQELCHMVAQGGSLVWVEGMVQGGRCRWRGCIVNGASQNLRQGTGAVMDAITTDDSTMKVAYGPDRLPWTVKVEKVSLDARSQALDAEPDAGAAGEGQEQLREAF